VAWKNNAVNDEGQSSKAYLRAAWRALTAGDQAEAAKLNRLAGTAYNGEDDLRDLPQALDQSDFSDIATFADARDQAILDAKVAYEQTLKSGFSNGPHPVDPVNEAIGAFENTLRRLGFVFAKIHPKMF
jgi:hypothetical protein